MPARILSINRTERKGSGLFLNEKLGVVYKVTLTKLKNLTVYVIYKDPMNLSKKIMQDGYLSLSHELHNTSIEINSIILEHY